MVLSEFKFDVLRVVTHRTWVFKELEEAALKKSLKCVQDYGFDLPPSEEKAFFWMPAPYASKLYTVGRVKSLTSPPANLLSKLPEKFTGRKVSTLKLKDFNLQGSGFCKPSDVKTDMLPAAFYDDVDVFKLKASEILLPDSSVQVSDKRFNIIIEYRFYVVNGEVVTGSPYLAGGVTYYDGLKDTTFKKEAFSKAQEVASYIKHNKLSSNAYVLDIMVTSEGCFVLEFNPVWCSGFYGCDLTSVINALIVSFSGGDFLWEPDPFYIQRALKAPLKA